MAERDGNKSKPIQRREPSPSGKRSRMRGAFMTCTETYGNGFRTGSRTTPPPMRWIRQGPRPGNLFQMAEPKFRCELGRVDPGIAVRSVFEYRIAASVTYLEIRAIAPPGQEGRSLGFTRIDAYSSLNASMNPFAFSIPFSVAGVTGASRTYSPNSCADSFSSPSSRSISPRL